MGDDFINKRKARTLVEKSTRFFLGYLSFELTERCNNNCIHCNINLPKFDNAAINRELSTKDIKNILIEAAAHGCREVRFTGGEPLIREDFTELYTFTRKLGIKVNLYTNALSITPELIQLFKKYPPGLLIEVSVYGMHADTYEAVSRIPGSFSNAMNGIKLIQESSLPFIVKGAYLQQNQNDAAEFEEWSESIPWMDTLPAYAMFLELRARRDSKEKNNHIRKLRVAPEQGLKFVVRDESDYRRVLREALQNSIGLPGENLFLCGAGKSGNVDAYGMLQPCLPLRHPETVYDLKNGSLNDAFKNFFPKIRRFKAKNQKYLNRCAKCFLFELCDQCPAQSWMEHGTLDTPVDYLCRTTHEKGKFLGLLNDGETSWKVRNWRERIDEFLNNS